MRAIRKAHRLTVRDLARAFRQASRQRLPQSLDQMIRSWERGTHRPSEMYVHLYEQVLPELAAQNGTVPEPDPAVLLERARHAPGRATIAGLQVAALRSGRPDVAALAETLLHLQRQLDAARDELERLLGEDSQ